MGALTSYFIKEQDGQTHHFRVTPSYNGVDIVEGVFYQWINKYFEGCASGEAAIAKANELVDAHLEDGFIVTAFEETPENTADVYDKAKWHFGGNFPADLDDFQGYIHTGMFLGWLIDTGLVSTQFADDSQSEITAFTNRQLTGAQVFECCCDGVLTLEDINETGNRFALHYFDFTNGRYLEDYEASVAANLPTLYHVKDTWDNYNRLKVILDGRFSEWRSTSAF